MAAQGSTEAGEMTVTVVLREPGMDLPLDTDTWEMYAEPEPGSHYWHGRTGYTVNSVERTPAETRVHLVRDPEWEDRLYADLREGLCIDGGRNSRDGMWHMRIIDPARGFPPVVSAVANDCEHAIRLAISRAS